MTALGTVSAAATDAERTPEPGTLRERLLLTATLGWTWLAAGTELLGAGHWLRPSVVLGWWSLGAALFLVLLRPWRGLGPLRRRLPSTPATRALAGLAAFLFSWTLAQAVLSPPNNVDSLHYHLPRQVYWLQAASVEHFPTSELRQLTMPPLSEYAGLHLFLLTGGDHWHNLVQWSAFACTAAAVSLLALELGGSTLAQLLAAALLLTAPPALAQASNTKNDLVVALWLTSSALWTLRLARRPQSGATPPSRLVLLLGCSLGCLVLTKGTALVLGAPLVLLAVFRLACRGWRALACALLLAGALDAPHVVRNWRAFGSAYGSDALAHGERVSNELVSPAALASNVARNLARQLALPAPAWNRALERGVVALHAWLGLSPDDPRTTYRQPPWTHVVYSPDHEDAVTAPAQVILTLALPFALWSVRRRVDTRAMLLLWLLVAGGFLVFCAVLKWQFWHGRLLIPLVALAAPVIAVATAALSARTALLALLATTVTVVPALNLVQRPLLGPAGLLSGSAGTVDRFSGLAPGAVTMVHELTTALRPRVVGLLDDSYVPMRLVCEVLPYRPRFTSFNARFNPNGLPEPAPDLVLGTAFLPDRLLHLHSGRSYVLERRVGMFAAYLPERGAGEP